MRSLLAFFQMVIAIALLVAAILFIVVVPQSLFAFFIRDGGAPMLLPLGALAACGRIHYKSARSGAKLWAFVIGAGCALLALGSYWTPFDPRDGFNPVITFNLAARVGMGIVAFCAYALFAKLRR